MPIQAWVLTALFLVACGSENSISTTMDSGSGGGGLDGSSAERDGASPDAASDAGADLGADVPDAAADAATFDAALADAATLDAAPAEDAAVVGIACRAPELTTAPYNVFENVRDDATGAELRAGASRVFVDEGGAPFVLFEVTRDGGTAEPSRSVYASRFVSLGDGRCEWSRSAEIVRFAYDESVSAARGAEFGQPLVAAYDGESGLVAVATPETRCVEDPPGERCDVQGFRLDVFPLEPALPARTSTGLRFVENTQVQGIALRGGFLHVAYIVTSSSLASATSHDVIVYEVVEAATGEVQFSKSAPSAFDFAAVSRTSIGRDLVFMPFFERDSAIFAWVELGLASGPTLSRSVVVRLASYDPASDSWYATNAREETFTTLSSLPTLAVATHESLAGTFVLASNIPRGVAGDDDVFAEAVTYDPGAFGGTHSTRGFRFFVLPGVVAPTSEPAVLELSASVDGENLDLDLFAYPLSCPGVGPDAFVDGPELTRYTATPSGATALAPYRLFLFEGTRGDDSCAISHKTSSFSRTPSGDPWMAFTLESEAISALPPGVYVWLGPL